MLRLRKDARIARRKKTARVLGVEMKFFENRGDQFRLYCVYGREDSSWMFLVEPAEAALSVRTLRAIKAPNDADVRKTMECTICRLFGP